MPKSYYNHAIIGNSSYLGCISNKGELIRLFWPNIDQKQHVDKIMFGVYLPEQRNSTLWLNEDQFTHKQRYVNHTNIVETVMENHHRGLRVIQTDFCLWDEDIMIRNFDIENLSNNQTNYGMIYASSFISAPSDLSNILYDHQQEAIVHYRHNSYIAISSAKPVYQFQLGNNAFQSAWYGELNGHDDVGMMQDGALAWQLGEFKPGEKKSITVFMCAAKTIHEVKRMTKAIQKRNYFELLYQTEAASIHWLERAKKIQTDDARINALYQRSLLVFKLMWDKNTGGLMAAPEVDEEFTKCGRYAYCWGRDAAFITEALDVAGLTAEVDKFYQWARDVQDIEGYWHQRYQMDGNLAPSWGIQIDETGSLLWGILSHYRHNHSLDFLNQMWETVEKGAHFLVRFMDKDTGLPLPSFDLWEERSGEHTYSAAAVWGGLEASVEIGEILGKAPDVISLWRRTAKRIKEATEKTLWQEQNKCFLRSVRVKLNPWGVEPSSRTVRMQLNSKGYCRVVSQEDARIDISLLGVSIPFHVFEVNDYRVVSTVEKIESKLTCPNVGGIKRYEDDNYIGGNPWILTTLWLALYYIEKKDFSKAKAYFNWAVKGTTEMGLLPEQISKDDGKPIWIFPLTWSHAMFVLVLDKLYEAGEI